MKFQGIIQDFSSRLNKKSTLSQQCTSIQVLVMVMATVSVGAMATVWATEDGVSTGRHLFKVSMQLQSTDLSPP